MTVMMLNKNIPNNGVKKTRTSCEGLLSGSLRMQEQVSGVYNQVLEIRPL